MIKLYIKQAFYQLRENRLISLVSIIGTALAICMIMVIVLVLEVRITDCVPEVNRSRSLYMKAMSIHQKEIPVIIHQTAVCHSQWLKSVLRHLLFLRR